MRAARPNGAAAEDAPTGPPYVVPRFGYPSHPDPRRIMMANKAKNATQPGPKPIHEPDRSVMVSLKTKKTKKTSRGK